MKPSRAKILIVLGICFLSILCSCAITPNHVESNTSYYDSTTPRQYDAWNSGFIGYGADGRGVITYGKLLRYNNMIDKYGKLLIEKGISIKANDGIKYFHDEYGNKLYHIDQEHLNYLIWMEQFRRDEK